MSAPGATRWLVKVRSDLDSAFNCTYGPRPTLGDAAYHVQQAAEKLLKAVLVAEAINPPLTHNLATLVRALPDEHPVASALAAFVRFTPYATQFRYPTDSDPEALPTTDELSGWIEEVTDALEQFERHLESLVPRATP